VAAADGVVEERKDMEAKKRGIGSDDLVAASALVSPNLSPAALAEDLGTLFLDPSDHDEERER